MDSRQMTKARPGFSLIELVIVVVIIGIIGAIAIPRLSRGAEGASDSALTGDLAVLRNALDLYATEHGGQYPAVGTFTQQLTLYSNATGGTDAAKGGAFIYGPYLRAVPALKVGSEKGSTGVAATPGAGVGWIYNATTGAINANTTTEKDASGKLYNTY